MSRTREQHPNPANVCLFIRTRFGLTQAKMAKLAGLGPNDISRFERSTRGMTVEKVVKIAAFLKLTVDELMRDDYGAVMLLLPEEVFRSSAAKDRLRVGQARKLEIGTAGEIFAANRERTRLAGTIYVKGVNENFANDPSSGFDFMSFTREGRPKYVEVKTTTGDCDDPFYMSAAEYRFLHYCVEHDLTYELHRVYRLKDAEHAMVRIYSARELLGFHFYADTYAVTRRDAV